MFDVITIGSATLDVFIESDDANIVSVSSTNKCSNFMSFPYGSKIEITDFSRNFGGGADDFAKLHSIAETAMKNGNSKFNAILAVVQQ